MQRERKDPSRSEGGPEASEGLHRLYRLTQPEGPPHDRGVHRVLLRTSGPRSLRCSCGTVVEISATS